MNYKNKIHENYLDINKICHSFRQEVQLLNNGLAETIYNLTKNVINNVCFQYWTASGKPYIHHYGTGGLIQHTKEVINIALSINETLNLNIDEFGEKIFLAALYHDFGKIYEYEAKFIHFGMEAGGVDINSISTEIVEFLNPHNYQITWEETSQKKKVYHVARSGYLWLDACKKFGYNDVDDEILHAILGHHGQREWKSVVEPQTKLAWLIHLSDMASARLNDGNNI